MNHLTNPKRCSHGGLRRFWYVCVKPSDDAPQGRGYNNHHIAYVRNLFLSIAIAAGAVVSNGGAFAQTTPYPQEQQQHRSQTTGPAKTAPTQMQSAPTTLSNTQTSKTQTRTSQSQFHQPNKEHGHGYSHGGGGIGVGIGANVDLSGVGQRRAEPDPFAVPAARRPVTARTEEKPQTPKKARDVVTTDPFAGLQLIGPKAKEEAASNRGVVNQTADTDPFASVDLATAKAKDLEKQERNYSEKQQ